MLIEFNNAQSKQPKTNHWIAERLLDRSGIAVTHLRPTLFAEWRSYFAREIKENNRLLSPFALYSILPGSHRISETVSINNNLQRFQELLDAFADFKYPNEIGPGVYDIHSPRVPSKEEIIALMDKARAVVPIDQLWVNPDCGLKTRQWPETETALVAMVQAAKELRQSSVSIA